jgi:ribosomal protein S14
MSSRFLVLIMCLCSFQVIARTNSEFCNKSLAESKIKALFVNALNNQIVLEFGKKPIDIYQIKQKLIGNDLVRVDSFFDYKKPGEESPSTKNITAFLSRCEGTTIIRGNSWLADGSLVVPRYQSREISGRGLILGVKNAPRKIIVYVDSRCPHCHRLIAYARELAKKGLLRIDIRQIALLETTAESLADSMLSESRLVLGKESSIPDSDYLDMISGFSNKSKIRTETKGYKQAYSLIKQNTKTAQEVLYITSVPMVLIQEGDDELYRTMGYWEMNRLFQPDL